MSTARAAAPRMPLTAFEIQARAGEIRRGLRRALKPDAQVSTVADLAALIEDLAAAVNALETGRLAYRPGPDPD